MRQIAVIGSGPAGFYTAEAAVKAWGDDVHIDIIDKLPVPYGLIRTGVAPDHQSIKAVSRRYEKTALGENVRFVGNITIGTDVSIDELCDRYDAVVLATGAPMDRTLEIPGGDLSGVFGSASFVGWYNGHPEYADLAPPLDSKTAVVIGNGNVALDVARILAKTEDEFTGSDIVGHALDALKQSNVEHIVLIGRRGPHQIAMTPKELGELGQLERAFPRVDIEDFPEVHADDDLEPGIRKSVGHLRSFHENAGDHDHKPLSIAFDFFAMPVAIEGDDRVERIVVEETELDADNRSRGTGKTYSIDCGMVISCIGYRTSPIPGVPYDESRGRFANEDGRIADGLYCVGWSRRGPTGTIGTNKPDGFAIVEKIGEDIGEGKGKAGAAGLDQLIRNRGIAAVSFVDWKAIEEAEIANAREGAPREKFTDVEEMIAVRD